MATEEMTSSVETIEIEAEKMLEEARSRANEILRKANEEASKILLTKMPLDEVKTECEQIVNKATKEADQEIEESKRKAAEIKTASNKKVEGIAKRIAGVITGAKSR